MIEVMSWGRSCMVEMVRKRYVVEVGKVVWLREVLGKVVWCFWRYEGGGGFSIFVGDIGTFFFHGGCVLFLVLVLGGEVLLGLGMGGCFGVFFYFQKKKTYLLTLSVSCCFVVVFCIKDQCACASVHLDVCARVPFWAKTFLEVKQKHVLLKDMHCNSLCMLATF